MIEAIKLWNEPNNLSHWDAELDPGASNDKIVKALVRGDVSLAVIELRELEGRAPELGGIRLPYLLDGGDQARAPVEGGLAAKLDAQTAPRGLRVLAVLDGRWAGVGTREAGELTGLSIGLRRPDVVTARSLQALGVRIVDMAGWVDIGESDGVVTTPPPDPTGLADVQNIEIQVLESYPLQVNVIARGQLPDAGCTTISGVSQTRSGNTFTVTITTKTDSQALCAQMLTPFEQVIPLEVGSLLPGPYIVRVNGVEGWFELPENPTQAPQ